MRVPWFWLVAVLAATTLAVVTLWVISGGGSRGDALKTGGLAGGSVVALYALWLNDRRRRVEERRVEHDEQRVADERFARAVELLGHEADQVRVGAMHALAGLARSRERYTQIALDVLCAYLRRPFDLPAKGDEAVRELQVRVTAQRLIADLLPSASDVDPPLYDLDLHGATLEFFDISHRVVGQLRARRTQLYESTSLKGLVVRREAWFTDARCPGRLYAPGIVFHDRCWFKQVIVDGVTDFAGAEFRGTTTFDNTVFGGSVSFQGARFTSNLRFNSVKVSSGGQHRLPDGFTIEPISREFGLVRDGSLAT